MTRFLACWDLHRGYERRSGHKTPLHDPRAWASVMKFAQDFKPHTTILGGDVLDCGPISHHNERKPRRTEGFRLQLDAEEAVAEVIKPLEDLTSGNCLFITGNHEDWIEDLLDKDPALEGLVDLEELLELQAWSVVPQGGYHKLGKLYFIHGDQIGGGVNAAKNAVEAYMQNVRLGHFHTYQVATKTSAVDAKLGKTGIVVPCLCSKDPKYNEGRPNRWVQGFLFGYVADDGTFTDYVVPIINGQFVVDGKTYRG